MLIHLSMKFASISIVSPIERYLSDLGGLPLSHQIHSWEFRGHRPFCDIADYIPWPHGPTTIPRGVDTMHRKYKYFGQTRFHAATPPFALPPDRREAQRILSQSSSSSWIHVNDSWEIMYLWNHRFSYGSYDIIVKLRDSFVWCEKNSFYIFDCAIFLTWKYEMSILYLSEKENWKFFRISLPL